MVSLPLPHDKLIKRLCNVIDFVFEGGNRTNICISKNNVAYWGNILTKLLFYVENSLLRQKIGIPMGIDPPPFWANLFLYTYGNEYISELIFTDKVKARHFHATKPFIDDTEFYWYLK